MRDVVVPNPALGFNLGRAIHPGLAPALIVMVRRGRGRAKVLKGPEPLLGRGDAQLLPSLDQQLQQQVLLHSPTHTSAAAAPPTCGQVVHTGSEPREEVEALLQPLRDLGPVQARDFLAPMQGACGQREGLLD